jgi:hypothetical protein
VVRPVASAAVPPGWYPDPAYPPGLRWWSGVEWTEHTSRDQWASPRDPEALTAIDFLVPTTRTSGPRALVWGIIALFANVVFLIPSIIAIVSGGIGIARANRLQREGRTATGRGLSIAGLSLGIISLVATLAILLALIIATR